MQNRLLLAIIKVGFVTMEALPVSLTMMSTSLTRAMENVNVIKHLFRVQPKDNQPYAAWQTSVTN